MYLEIGLPPPQSSWEWLVAVMPASLWDSTIPSTRTSVLTSLPPGLVKRERFNGVIVPQLDCDPVQHALVCGQLSDEFWCLVC